MLPISWSRFVTVDKSSFIGSWYGDILQYDFNYLVYSNFTVAILFCCFTTGKWEWSQTFIPFIRLLLELLLVDWPMRTLKSIKDTERKDNCPMLTHPDTPMTSSLICSAEGSSFAPWKIRVKSYSCTILGFNGNNRVWGAGWCKGWFSSYLSYWHQFLLDPEKEFFPCFVLVSCSFIYLLGFFPYRSASFTKLFQLAWLLRVLLRFSQLWLVYRKLLTKATGARLILKMKSSSEDVEDIFISSVNVEAHQMHFIYVSIHMYACRFFFCWGGGVWGV